MNEPMRKSMPAAISSGEFFDRTRARLNFDVPAGLTDASVIPPSGDRGTDRMLEIGPGPGAATEWLRSRVGTLTCTCALSPAGTRAGAKPTSQRTGRSTAESGRSA